MIRLNYIVLSLALLGILNVTSAQTSEKIPVLDRSSLQKKTGINKCTNEKGEHLYTQSPCPEGYLHHDKNWQEEANVSYIVGGSQSGFIPKNSHNHNVNKNTQNAKSSASQNRPNTPQDLKDINLNEALIDGLKYLFNRDQFIKEHMDN